MANVPHTVYYKVNGTGPQLTKEYMAENRDAAELLFKVMFLMVESIRFYLLSKNF